jgi:hypothetical protein
MRKKPFEAQLKINYELYQDKKGKVMLDSATRVLYDYKTDKNNANLLLRVDIPLKLGPGGLPQGAYH